MIYKRDNDRKNSRASESQMLVSSLSNQTAVALAYPMTSLT